jgi:hypothetical protein
VVDQHSALLDYPLEEEYCINANHQDMIKYDSLTNNTFRVVWGKLAMMLAGALSGTATPKEFV